MEPRRDKILDELVTEIYKTISKKCVEFNFGKLECSGRYKGEKFVIKIK